MRVHDWQLERYRLGELEEGERRAVEQALRDDPGIAARLRELDAADAAFLAAHPPATVAAAVRTRAEAPVGPRRLIWRTLALASLPAAAAVLLLVRPAPPPEHPPAPVATERAKGEAQLVLHRRGEAAPLVDGAAARAGDVLQLSVRVTEPSYAAVLSLDGRGAVTVHLPDGAAAASVSPGGLVSLPHAYELDDAPELERFVLVTSAAPFALADVRAAAEKLAASPRHASGELDLPPALSQRWLTLRKVSP
jgi:hypothetical protein